MTSGSPSPDARPVPQPRLTMVRPVAQIQIEDCLSNDVAPVLLPELQLQVPQDQAVHGAEPPELEGAVVSQTSTSSCKSAGGHVNPTYSEHRLGQLDERLWSVRMATCASHVVTKYPVLAFTSCCSIMLAVTTICLISGEILVTQAGERDWIILSDEHTLSRDGIREAWNAADCFLPSGLACGTEDAQERSLQQPGEDTTIILYEVPHGNIFTPTNLQNICRVENYFIGGQLYPEYCQLKPNRSLEVDAEGRTYLASDCAPQAWLVASRFYTYAGLSTADCPLLDDQVVADYTSILFQLLANPDTAFEAGAFLGSDALSGQTRRTRSWVQLGAPLGAAHEGESYGPYFEATEKALMSFFDKNHRFLHSAYWDDWKIGEMSILFEGRGFLDLEIPRVINSDMFFVIASTVFVWSCLVYRSGSVFVGTVSTGQIMLSLPLAFFIYRFVLQITYFQQLHVILIFVMLGIGADDVFVYSDAWFQFESIVTRCNVTHDEALVLRCKMAYHRTLVTVFNTSFTTAAAFFATATSPVMPIRTMGIFASLLVFLNYVFAITLTPCVFVMRSRYLVCRCAKSASPNCIRKGSPSTHCASFFKYLISLLSKRLVAVCSILTMIVWGGLNCYWASCLKPPAGMFRYFGPAHMSSEAADLDAYGYMWGWRTEYMHMTVSFGIDGIDREAGGLKVDPWRPDATIGEPVFSESFNLSTLESQEYLRAYCARLRSTPCTSSACAGGRLVDPAPESIRCFIENFDVWSGNETLEGQAFVDQLLGFRSTLDESQQKDIGFIDGELRYVTVHAKLTARRNQPTSSKDDLLSCIMDYLGDEQVQAPISIGKILHMVDYQWIYLATEKALIAGLFQGFVLCFPIAFLVVMCATQNVVVAVLSVASIALTVMCVLGWCFFVEGWNLGITESIAGVIVIGLSVDYVLHLGHMYLDAGFPGCSTRDARWTMALNKMGTTVVAGAGTTFIAGFTMRFCQLSFFKQMSTLISVTVMYSALYSMLFFMSILRVSGPEGKTGDLLAMIANIRTWAKTAYSNV